MLDLKSIVTKATSTGELERYRSVGELALDIQCVIDEKPASARRLAGKAAVVSKIRRKASLISALCATLFVTVLLVMFVVKTRSDATDRAIVAQGLSSYLVSLINVMDPETRTDNSISAHEVLDLGIKQARANLPSTSVEYLKIVREIGGLYLKVGAFHQAQNLLSEVLSSSVQMDEQFLAGANLDLGRVLHSQGSNDDAEIHLAKSLQLLGNPTGSSASLYSDVLEELAFVAVDQNRLEIADSLADVCFNMRKRWLGPESSAVASSIQLKARVRWRSREYKEAEVLYRRALDVEKMAGGPRTLGVARILNDLGLVYVDMGEYLRAGELLNAALEIKRSILGPTHPSFATTLVNLAPVVENRFGADSAEAMMRRVVNIYVANSGFSTMRSQRRRTILLYT